MMGCGNGLDDMGELGELIPLSPHSRSNKGFVQCF